MLKNFITGCFLAMSLAACGDEQTALRIDEMKANISALCEDPEGYAACLEEGFNNCGDNESRCYQAWVNACNEAFPGCDE